MKKFNERFLISSLFTFIIITDTVYPQQNFATHTRGKLWETLYNWGFIGDPGAWDYNQTTGIGFYPGFSGFDFPRNEIDANGYITDANLHNFRSGPWIIAKGGKTLIGHLKTEIIYSIIPHLQPELKESLKAALVLLLKCATLLNPITLIPGYLKK